MFVLLVEKGREPGEDNRPMSGRRLGFTRTVWKLSWKSGRVAPLPGIAYDVMYFCMLSFLAVYSICGHQTK